MKKVIFLFLLVYLTSVVNAQSITMGTISSGGDSFANAQSMLSFTTGEVNSGTFKNGNNVITQGFQQTYYTYWVGKINTAWEDTLNWNGPFPGVHTDVVILSVVPNNPFISSNANCRRLFARPGSFITVNGGFRLTLSK